jgi:hypothetical protein
MWEVWRSIDGNVVIKHLNQSQVMKDVRGGGVRSLPNSITLIQSCVQMFNDDISLSLTFTVLVLEKSLAGLCPPIRSMYLFSSAEQIRARKRGGGCV